MDGKKCSSTLAKWHSPVVFSARLCWFNIWATQSMPQWVARLSRGCAMQRAVDYLEVNSPVCTALVYTFISLLGKGTWMSLKWNKTRVFMLLSMFGSCVSHSSNWTTCNNTKLYLESFILIMADNESHQLKWLQIVVLSYKNGGPVRLNNKGKNKNW